MASRVIDTKSLRDQRSSASCPSGFYSADVQAATNYPYDIYSAKLVAAPAYYRRDIADPNMNLRVFINGVYDQYESSEGVYSNTGTQFDLHPIQSVYSTFGWGHYPNGYGQGIHPGKFNSYPICSTEPIAYASDMPNFNRDQCNFDARPDVTNLSI